MGFCWIRPKGIYNNDDIQGMLRFLTFKPEERDEFIRYTHEHFSDGDIIAIKKCIKSGWYESFDRYDSAVCENFVEAFIKLFIDNKKYNTYVPKNQFAVVGKYKDKYGVVDIEDYAVDLFSADELFKIVRDGIAIDGVDPRGRIHIC